MLCKHKHLFALLGAEIIFIDEAMVIMSCWSEALISSYMYLCVIRVGQMNCFVRNAGCLVDRNLSKYKAHEGRREIF